MYFYNISTNTNNGVFLQTCKLIESHITIIDKAEHLTDVDGTEIKIFYTPGGKIKVFNDYEVDAVYVDSEIELNDIF